MDGFRLHDGGSREKSWQPRHGTASRFDGSEHADDGTVAGTIRFEPASEQEQIGHQREALGVLLEMPSLRLPEIGNHARQSIRLIRRQHARPERVGGSRGPSFPNRRVSPIDRRP